MKSTNKIAFVFSLIFLSSCGGNGSGGSSTTPNTQLEQASRPDAQMEQIDEGQFVAKLQSLNPSIAGSISGSVTFSKEDKDLFIDVRFVGKNPKIIQTQYIHEGSACPTSAQDTNSDGVIDAAESYAFTGQVLIPLDGDISSQDRGSSLFPMTDEFGSYSYYEYASYKRFMDDLKDGDLDPTDDFIKLGQDKTLSITTRVVMIYGVPKESKLPPTVAGRGRLSNFQTLPIACGVFSKITQLPGSVDTDSGLGPVPDNTTGGAGNGSDDGTVVIFDENNHDTGTSGGTTGGDYGNDGNTTTSTTGASHGGLGI